jgi:hypothetical protein
LFTRLPLARFLVVADERQRGTVVLLGNIKKKAKKGESRARPVVLVSISFTHRMGHTSFNKTQIISNIRRKEGRRGGCTRLRGWTEKKIGRKKTERKVNERGGERKSDAKKRKKGQ